MQLLLSIMRPLAKKGLIEKYKKARLANYNAITILFLTLDHNLFNILYHCTLLLLYHSFWQSFCMKKRKHSSPFFVIVLKTFAAYPILIYQNQDMYSHFRNYAPPPPGCKRGHNYGKSFPSIFWEFFLDLFWLGHVHLGVNGCHRKVCISNVKK